MNEDHLDPDKHLYFDEYCECCGNHPHDCTCPECNKCGEQGNPECATTCGLPVERTMPDPHLDGRIVREDGSRLTDPMDSPDWSYGNDQDQVYVSYAIVNGIAIIHGVYDYDSSADCADLFYETYEIRSTKDFGSHVANACYGAVDSFNGDTFTIDVDVSAIQKLQKEADIAFLQRKAYFRKVD
jgi:hypothetical protein